MHPLAFHAKRFHHRNLAHGRKMLARFNLTPARFDLLYALYEHHQGDRFFGAFRPSSLRQVDLCKLLGVTSRTVARMVASLVELDILHRVRSRIDRRANAVSFTREGLLRVRRAVHAIVHKNPFQRLYHWAWPNIEPESDRYRGDRFMLLDGLYTMLMALAKHLGDFATLRLPAHHPDD